MAYSGLGYQQDKATMGVVWMLAISFALGFIYFLASMLPNCGVLDQSCTGFTRFSGDFLLGRTSEASLYPITVRNLMWIFFFLCLSWLWIQKARIFREKKQIQLSLLPEEESAVLRPRDLGDIFARSKATDNGNGYFLQNMIKAVALQFQSSKSIVSATTSLQHCLELSNDESRLKFVTWRAFAGLLPLIGFIGTLLLIGATVSKGNGAIAFTSVQLVDVWRDVSLLLAALYPLLLGGLQFWILSAMANIFEAQEKTTLNLAAHYCTDNLISRLYVD